MGWQKGAVGHKTSGQFNIPAAPMTAIRFAGVAGYCSVIDLRVVQQEPTLLDQHFYALCGSAIRGRPAILTVATLKAKPVPDVGVDVVCVTGRNREHEPSENEGESAHSAAPDHLLGSGRLFGASRNPYAWALTYVTPRLR